MAEVRTEGPVPATPWPFFQSQQNRSFGEVELSANIFPTGRSYSQLSLFGFQMFTMTNSDCRRSQVRTPTCAHSEFS